MYSDCVLWTIGNILQVFLICRPFRAIYDPTVKGTCGNRVGTFIAIGAFNWGLDLIILIIPIPVVWKLQTTRPMKVALTGVFCFGFLCVSPARLRIVYQSHALRAFWRFVCCLEANLFLVYRVTMVAIIRMWSLTRVHLDNFTQTEAYPLFLSILEVFLSLICISLPMLYPLWHLIWPCCCRGRSQTSNEIANSESLDNQNEGYCACLSFKSHSSKTSTISTTQTTNTTNTTNTTYTTYTPSTDYYMTSPPITNSDDRETPY